MITREEAKEKIKKLIDEFLVYQKEEINNKSENQIKSEFIDPLFEALGWDMRKDAEREERVLKGKADYILRIGNQDKCVIEAKKVSVRLSEEEGRQVVSYAHHKNIKFAILTNFKQIRVYHALSNIKNIDSNLLKDGKGYLWLNYEDFISQFDRLWLLSKESFEKEEINKLLKNVDKRLIKPIDETILKDLLQFREWLSKDLKNKRAYLSNFQIDEIVQILIDRLIFMRSVEDRGLEGKDFLLKIVEDVKKGITDKNLWALLKEQFLRFDNTYNSKLFSQGLLEKEGAFSDDELIRVVRGLYYGTQDNQERYMFDEIPVDLLGSIYEQYLGVVLRGTEKRVKLENGHDKRKKMGIYYTPSYIVDYIVKNSVGEYIKNKSIDKILDVKILDPACGSGSFLIKAFGKVCNKIEELIKKGEKSNNPTFKNYDGRLNLAQKITILTRCIYGVDLDEKAVELTQLNLLLKLLEEETRETRKRVLPNMKDNIKNGNSLIDDSSVSDKAFKWEAQFPDVFKSGGFDVVVGNPPYIFARSQKFSDKEKKYYYDRYKLQSYQLNTYGLFVELSYNLLKKEGKFGFIIPNNWLTIDTFSKFREFIISNSSGILIINIFDKVFSEASVDTGILIFSKDKSDNISLFEMREQKLESFGKYNSSDFKDKIINISSLKNKEGSKIIEKVESVSDRLEELSTIKAGLKAYETGKGNPKQTDSMKVNRIYHSNIQKDKSYYRYLEGKDVRRYYLGWSGLYLKYGRCLAAPRIFDLFSNERILVRQIPSKLPYCINAILVKENLLNDINSMIIYKFKKYSSSFILAILNSKLISYWFVNKFGKLQRGLFPQFKVKELASFPIPKNIPEKTQKKIIELVNQMLFLQKKYHDEKIAGNEKERIEQQIKQTNWEIDEEVYKLYNLTPEEIKIVEESLK